MSDNDLENEIKEQIKIEHRKINQNKYANLNKDKISFRMKLYQQRRKKILTESQLNESKEYHKKYNKKYNETYSDILKETRRQKIEQERIDRINSFNIKKKVLSEGFILTFD